jgi:hypothetical protein
MLERGFGAGPSRASSAIAGSSDRSLALETWMRLSHVLHWARQAYQPRERDTALPWLRRLLVSPVAAGSVGDSLAWQRQRLSTRRRRDSAGRPG